ncbi:DUF4468 domain-containing protein [Dyadobacter aurulentus]|uniref:DUF4468 domain-containing protein n=1 Tax=Dyadobacter sp. UC 10 TaxID=2605428 RepID=UPI0011F1E248|nr:DUF4468 domain-containing protein [Dyadobacter sp. UC 10]KAA0992983.1 DUF4468 domain-containing protein [Dyadobacter sp. UC 10]
MLKLSFFIICFSVMITQASPVLSPPQNENSFLTETVDCGSVAQIDLFRRARLWVAQAHPDGKVLVSDKETGDLVVQGLTSINIPRSENSSGGVYQFRYALVIECANRKYRATIHNVELLDVGNGKFTPIRPFPLKSEKDLQAFNTQLGGKFNSMFNELRENVKDYTPF